MFAGKLNAARARCGPSNDDEAVRVEDLAQSAAESGVVVDNENPSAHGQILPATVSWRSVASSTLSRPELGKSWAIGSGGDSSCLRVSSPMSRPRSVE